jgi:hypothetical protein
MICPNCESTEFACGGCGVNLQPEDAYTAAEVKVLTETASKVAYTLGRKDAGEEIAAKLKQRRDAAHDIRQPGWPLLTEAWVIALSVVPQASGAASDAISVPSEGPGTSEPSKAAKTPPKLACRRCNGYGLLGVTAGVNPVLCPDCALPARETEL